MKPKITVTLPPEALPIIKSHDHDTEMKNQEIWMQGYQLGIGKKNTQTPDEKVLDYLKRAEQIISKFNQFSVNQPVATIETIEIAKLLQRETNK